MTGIMYYIKNEPINQWVQAGILKAKKQGLTPKLVKVNPAQVASLPIEIETLPIEAAKNIIEHHMMVWCE